MERKVGEVRIDVVRDDSYRTIVVNGVFGGHRPGFFEAIIYTDEMVADEALSSMPPCLLYTSPSPRDLSTSRMPSSA